MKKRTIFLMMLVVLFSLFAVSLTKADAAEVTYDADWGAVLDEDAKAEGKVKVIVEGGNGRLVINFGDGVALTTATNYLKFSGHVTNAARLDMYMTFTDGSHTVKWIAGVEGADSSKRQVSYIDANAAATLELGEFTFCGAPGASEPSEPEDDGTLKVSDIVSHPETATVTKDGSDQVIKYSALSGWATYDMNVTNYDSKYSVVEIEFTSSHEVAICVVVNGCIDWGVGHKVYKAGENTISFDMAGNDYFTLPFPKEFTLSLYIDVNADNHGVVESEETVTLHSVEFKEPAPVVEEPDDGTLKIGKIASHPKATITENATGEQVITYSERPGWHTFDMVVKHFDQNPAANTMLEIKFTASASIRVEIHVNGVGGYDHPTYAGNKEQTILVDISEMNLPEEFTISMYIDAPDGTEVTEEKTVTIHSVKFVEPAPEPEGMFLTVSKDGSITVVEGDEGWDISYTAAETWQANEYRNVKFTVNNFEAGCDVVHVKLNLTQGTNVCIWVNYADGSYVTVRDHWAGELVASESKVYDLGFLMSAYGKAEGTIASIVVYFDNPTEYTTNNAAVEAQILAVELLKSSDLDLSDVTFTVEGATMDYNGSRPTLTITNEVADLDYRYEYRAAGTDGEWSKGLPTNAGTYEVRVSFMGNLEYNPATATATVTINKVNSSVAAEDVTVDADTRVVTIKAGIEASTDADFTELLEDGDTVNYGTTIYYRNPGDANHEASDVLTITVERPAQEPSDDPTDEPTDEPSGESPVTPAPEKEKGCGGSVIASIFGILVLASSVVVLRKKREE